MSALNSHAPLSRDRSSSAAAGVKVAVRQALVEDRPGQRPVQVQPLGLAVFLVPAQLQPPQAFEDGVSDCRVLRSTSVSSMRRIIVPRFRRAYSQLKMKVRALPMCRKPVGEGAKRTRIMDLSV
jgi:hypothetical protein